jgi:hypothetical protein
VIIGSTVGRAFPDGVLLAHPSHGSFAVGYLFVSLFLRPYRLFSLVPRPVRTDRTALSFPTLLAIYWEEPRIIDVVREFSGKISEGIWFLYQENIDITGTNLDGKDSVVNRPKIASSLSILDVLILTSCHSFASKSFMYLHLIDRVNKGKV